MKYCTKMGLCAWRSLLNGRASCVSTEPCELAVAPENDAQQLQAKIRAAIKEMERYHHTLDFGNGYRAFVEKMRELSAVQ